MKIGGCGLALLSNQACKNRMRYMAPEVFEGRRGKKSDVWSLGITLIEMAEGKNPFADCNSEEEVKNRVCNGTPPRLPTERWSFQFVDVVANCLLQDVDERASASELLNVRMCV